MMYLGNYSDWIQPKWLEEVLSFDGYRLQDVWYHDDAESAMKETRSDTDDWLFLYDKKNLSFNIPTPPWTENPCTWWIVKYYPGHFLHMHVDPITEWNGVDDKRWWIPLMDYQDGHIFIYKDQFVSDYSSGDVYEYYQATDLHGAANIGYTPRVVLQISEVNE